MQFLEVVSTGNVREATDTEWYDRWNDEFTQNQRDQLYPYYIERWNNSSTYLTNIPTAP